MAKSAANIVTTNGPEKNTHMITLVHNVPPPPSPTELYHGNNTVLHHKVRGVSVSYMKLIICRVVVK